METQSVAVTLTDGAVSIRHIVVGAPLNRFSPALARAHGFKKRKDGWYRKLTDEAIKEELSRSNWVADIHSPSVPLTSVMKSWKRVSAVPGDRTFREAWAVSGDSVNIDMPKARVVAHGIRRRIREAEFEPLDKAIIVAAADPKGMAEVEGKRQRVRDRYTTMQKAIDQAASPEALQAALRSKDDEFAAGAE